MKEKTVIYYNRGNKCLNRLVVSVHSLRKVWNGDIIILTDGPQDPFIMESLKKMGCEIVSIGDSNKYPLAVKPSLHKWVDHKYTMFMDADTLVLKPIDEYFELIKENGFVTGGFANWKTTGCNIAKRIRDWKKAFPELIKPAIEYGKAINTGINGWVKGNPILAEWENVCAKGYAMNCTRRVVDEIACQLIIPHNKHYLAETKWGESVKFGKLSDETVIIHYHGSKHCGDNYDAQVMWKEAYDEVVAEGLLDGDARGDRSLQVWLKNRVNLNKKATLVTAVNKDYFGKFIKHLPTWAETRLINEMNLLVFCAEDAEPLIKRSIIKWPNKITFVREKDWYLGTATTTREKMLSAFVFGVAKRVKTQYWVKLDCDTKVVSQYLQIPKEAFNATLTGHKWGYTKCKKDPEFEKTGKNWLNVLDEWADKLPDFKGTKRLFNKIDGARHRHERVCTFFAVEKTAWTRHLAKMCGDRMPVPSQDTLSWYGITRLKNGRKVIRANFKKWLKP